MAAKGRKKIRQKRAASKKHTSKSLRKKKMKRAKQEKGNVKKKGKEQDAGVLFKRIIDDNFRKRQKEKKKKIVKQKQDSVLRQLSLGYADQKKAGEKKQDKKEVKKKSRKGLFSRKKKIYSLKDDEILRELTSGGHVVARKKLKGRGEEGRERKKGKKETEEKITAKEIKTKVFYKVPHDSVCFSTIFDDLYEFIRLSGRAKLSHVCNKYGIKKNKGEKYFEILSETGLVKMIFPVVGDAKIEIIEKHPPVSRSKGEGKLLENYLIKADDVSSLIEIRKKPDDIVPEYSINMPILGPGTKAFIDYLVERISEEITVELEELMNPKKAKLLKKKFYNNALERIVSILDSKANSEVIAGIILHKMHGLGDIDVLLSDNNLEEIVVNSSETPLVIYHKKHGWLKTTKKYTTEEDIYNLASEIGRKAQREISNMNPIMDAHLSTGDRVAATLFPISTLGNTVTIRRFARSPWTVPLFLSKEYFTLSSDIAAFLWQAIEYELNVMVAGGTAAGKTSVLNALCAMIPPNQRIISIEDTREIYLPKYIHWNWVPLTTRKPNPEGQGGVEMLDLMVSSLRMRPDRIIVGEIRKKRQAETMFEAMHTGHSVCTTMHADTADQVRKRLLEPPIEIPKNELEALQLILIQYRDRRRNIRKSYELVEVLVSESEELEMNYLYRWEPRFDTFDRLNSSIRVVEELNLHTGMTESEINKDLSDRKVILEWLLKRKVFGIEKFGNVMKQYYIEPERVIKAARSNQPVNDIFK